MPPPVPSALFDIAQRQRVAEIPAHGTKNQLRRRLPPLEDCRSGCVLHGLFSLPATPAKVATHPTGATIDFLLSALRDAAAAERLFRKALSDVSLKILVLLIAELGIKYRNF